MFPFPANQKSAPVSEETKIPAKTHEPHPLDLVTGGAFSAPTSSERTARIREWLISSPGVEQMQAVFNDFFACLTGWVA